MNKSKKADRTKTTDAKKATPPRSLSPVEMAEAVGGDGGTVIHWP
jgi:hypothetical protein